jgi:hypothetical protein
MYLNLCLSYLWSALGRIDVCVHMDTGGGVISHMDLSMSHSVCLASRYASSQWALGALGVQLVASFAGCVTLRRVTQTRDYTLQ